MQPRRRALVVVLGDLGRSPRMLLHAQSLSAIGCDVDLVGFDGAQLPDAVANDPRIRVLRIASFDGLRGQRPVSFLAAAASRQIALAFALLIALLRVRHPRVVLLQNPPALPALPLVLCLASLWRARVAIDWHNFTASMLRLRPGGGSIARLVETIEAACARRATVHLAASRQIAERLRGEFGIDATVVPDRAPATFLPAEKTKSTVPTIVVPTSWGVDEDFALLAEAARLCDESGVALNFLITGEGESRRANEKRFASMRLEHVSIQTQWFAPEDYPRALASADLGVCLHRSASGADAPMKVPEMLACGLPVAALDGPPMRDSLREGEEGFFFSDANDLASKIESLFSGWPDAPELDRLRRCTREAQRPRWDEEWNRSARPLIESALA